MPPIKLNHSTAAVDFPLRSFNSTSVSMRSGITLELTRREASVNGLQVVDEKLAKSARVE
jgi:hypothetical protein